MTADVAASAGPGRDTEAFAAAKPRGAQASGLKSSSERAAIVQISESGVSKATDRISPFIASPPVSGLAAPTAGEDVADESLTRPVGNLDRVGFDEISGWAWDPDHPELSVDIEILDGDVVLLKVSADQFRPDLAGAGMGTGHHGFVIRNLGGVLPLSRHLVRVRRASDGKTAVADLD